jgi:hypothetical protein
MNGAAAQRSATDLGGGRLTDDMDIMSINIDRNRMEESKVSKQLATETISISLVGGATVSLLRFRNAYVEAEGIRPLQVLLANVVRCPSHPRTTALDAGHPVSGIWKQGDPHDWQPHHTSPSYLSPLPSTRLNTSLSSPAREGRRIMSFSVPIPEAVQTQTTISILYILPVC